ncbi:hypothetical protein [Pseudonocardia spinosispora]|uniref:hypothetical protein n=1 Tax=Pseudonocardia spinosispora TaxID=103441 RepID=UPI000401E88C|nr:hypothetical protein [Pseudonocardia spinosispora]
MSGRVLTSSAITDIATGQSIYARAFLVAAVELGMSLPTPSSELLHAWASVPTESRALLELFLDAPAVQVEELDATTASAAGVRAWRMHQGVDVAAAHAVEVAIARDLPILTANPAPVRAISSAVQIEELPEL